MGAAIDALAEGVSIIKRNPLLVLVAFATFVVTSVAGVVFSLIPLVGSLVNFVVIVPVSLSGLLSLTNAAATGDASMGDFTDGIRNYWKPMAGAYALLFGVVFVGSFVFAIAMVVFFIGGGALSDPSSIDSMLLTLLLFVGIPGLVFSIVVQFVDVAVVVGEKSPTGAFRDAWNLFASDPFGTIGYGLLRFAVAMSMYVVPGLFVGSFVLSGADLNLLVIALSGVSFLVVAPLAMALALAYHVAYYRQRRDIGGREGHRQNQYGQTDAVGWR